VRANRPGDPATRWNCPSGRGLCADLHSKNEDVLKVAQRALLPEYSPFDATSLLALLITLRSILRSRLDLQIEILSSVPSNRSPRTLGS
jgi:hypothetical protein